MFLILFTLQRTFEMQDNVNDFWNASITIDRQRSAPSTLFIPTLTLFGFLGNFQTPYYSNHPVCLGLRKTWNMNLISTNLLSIRHRELNIEDSW